MLPILFLFATKAYALNTGVAINKQTSFNGYCGYLKAFSEYAITVGLILALMMIAYAGIRYVTSQGNQTILNDAKEILYGVAIGFILLFFISFIVRFLVGSTSCTTSTATPTVGTGTGASAGTGSTAH